MVNVEVEGKLLTMELCTGAALTSISYSEFLKLNLNKIIFSTHAQLRTYTGEPKGVAYVKFQYKNKSFFGKLYSY